MRAALAGDAVAYQRLLKDLAPALRVAARRGLVRVGGSQSEAEDVVQETLLAIHLKRHTWDAAAPIGPWISAIVRHKVIDQMRRRGRRIDVPIDDFAETLPDETASVAEPVARDVARHLMHLPDRQRDVVRAVAVDGASIAETAARLDMTAGAVRVALHRGLAALAAKLRTAER